MNIKNKCLVIGSGRLTRSLELSIASDYVMESIGIREFSEKSSRDMLEIDYNQFQLILFIGIIKGERLWNIKSLKVLLASLKMASFSGRLVFFDSWSKYPLNNVPLKYFFSFSEYTAIKGYQSWLIKKSSVKYTIFTLPLVLDDISNSDYYSNLKKYSSVTLVIKAGIKYHFAMPSQIALMIKGLTNNSLSSIINNWNYSEADDFFYMKCNLSKSQVKSISLREYILKNKKSFALFLIRENIFTVLLLLLLKIIKDYFRYYTWKIFNRDNYFKAYKFNREAVMNSTPGVANIPSTGEVLFMNYGRDIKKS